MGTVMIYNSVASTFVKPDSVELTIRFKSFNENSSDAVKNINEKRQLIKKFISEKRSYQSDSYRQYALDLKKKYYKEFYFKNTNTGTKITEEAYNSLSVEEKVIYSRHSIDKMLGYEANLMITVSLSYGETVVKDLVNIFNACIELDAVCTYNHTISKTIVDDTMKDLYTKCINNGIENVQKIVDGLNICNQSIFLTRISDSKLSSMQNSDRMFSAKATMYDAVNSSYEPELIIMPELIEELFNNNIELTKSLDLEFEFM